MAFTVGTRVRSASPTKSPSRGAKRSSTGQDRDRRYKPSSPLSPSLSSSLSSSTSSSLYSGSVTVSPSLLYTKARNLLPSPSRPRPRPAPMVDDYDDGNAGGGDNDGGTSINAAPAAAPQSHSYTDSTHSDASSFVSTTAPRSLSGQLQPHRPHQPHHRQRRKPRRLVEDFNLLSHAPASPRDSDSTNLPTTTSITATTAIGISSTSAATATAQNDGEEVAGGLSDFDDASLQAELIALGISTDLIENLSGADAIASLSALGL